MMVASLENWQISLHFVYLCLCRELNDNLLTGHIPPELGKLTDLFDLYIRFPLSRLFYFGQFCVSNKSSYWDCLLAEMLPTTTSMGQYLIIWALAPTLTACMYLTLFLFLIPSSSYYLRMVVDLLIWWQQCSW